MGDDLAAANVNRSYQLAASSIAIFTFMLFFLYPRFASGEVNALLFQAALVVMGVATFSFAFATFYYYTASVGSGIEDAERAGGYVYLVRQHLWREPRGPLRAGEPLSAFRLAGPPTAADRHPGGLAGVDEAGDERRLGADDDEVHRELARQRGGRGRVVGVHGVHRDELRDPGVARRAVHLLDLGIGQQCADDCVFAASGAQYQNLHALRLVGGTGKWHIVPGMRARPRPRREFPSPLTYWGDADLHLGPCRGPRRARAQRLRRGDLPPLLLQPARRRRRTGTSPGRCRRRGPGRS